MAALFGWLLLLVGSAEMPFLIWLSDRRSEVKMKSEGETAEHMNWIDEMKMLDDMGGMVLPGQGHWVEVDEPDGWSVS